MSQEEFNAYGRQLTRSEIESGEHRAFIGGLWDEIGTLQLAFLRAQGLRQHHFVLDVGCGALRGGVPLIRYLEPGHYFGFDINASLIEAGEFELIQAGLATKSPSLMVNDRFEADRFSQTFDYAMAQSVFTHLPMNHIVRCLVETRKVLKPGGVFFATFFEAPTPAWTHDLVHSPGGITTHFDADPYHYAFAEMAWMGRMAGLEATLIGDWGHPRGQRMLSYLACPH